MSRTTLTVLTAAGLAALSLGVMIARYQVLGHEAQLPAGTWKVTLIVRGVSEGDARLTTALPLELARQHVLHETYASKELFNRPPEARHPERRQVIWSRRPGITDGPFHARCEYYVALANPRSAPRDHGGLYAAPESGLYLQPLARNSADAEQITALARELTAGMDNPTDVAEALYHFVDREIANEPRIAGRNLGAVECLQEERGDSAAKARLLTALLRNRGIPARLVTGVSLAKGPEQHAHHWVEAWVHDHWLPLCPFHHHFGRVPSTYLVFALGDQPLVRGRHVQDLDYAFLIERTTTDPDAAASALRRFFLAVSLHQLPPAEQQLAHFLLLLPAAALIVCVFRNVIGLYSFGTFAPALVGLAFRDLHGMPGILVFTGILLVGWLMRRLLDSYHLLQVPRVALMLSLIVIVLLAGIVFANQQHVAATKYFALFPMVILTGMVERFWTLEAEDGTAASFKTLLSTLLIAGTIALVLSRPALVRYLFAFPETLGLIMAGQLLVGRYVGYRLTELWRFRDFVRPTAFTVGGLPERS
jgi:hypothetical protein